MAKRGWEQAFPSSGLRKRSLVQFEVNRTLLKGSLPYAVKPAPRQEPSSRERNSIASRFALQMAGLPWSALYPGVGLR